MEGNLNADDKRDPAAVSDVQPNTDRDVGAHLSIVVQSADKAQKDDSAGIDSYLNAATALLWPVIVIALAWWLRAELRQILASLAARLADPRTEISAGPLKLVTLESRVESIELNQTVGLSSLAGGATAADAPVGSVPQALIDAANQYLNVDIPDWNARVQRKDEIAAAMARMVVQANISRTTLAASTNEALRMALATAINLDPRTGDDVCVATGGKNLKRLHVRYRFAMAMARLVERRLVKPESIIVFRQLCAEYSQGADASLHTRIARTLAVLEQPAP